MREAAATLGNRRSLPRGCRRLVPTASRNRKGSSALGSGILEERPEEWFCVRRIIARRQLRRTTFCPLHKNGLSNSLRGKNVPYPLYFR